MENVVVNIVNGLDGNFKSMICCLETSGPLEKKIRKHHATVFVLNKKPGFKIKLFFSLARLMRNQAVDIVHTHNYLGFVYGVPAALLARVPLIFHCEHGTPIVYNLKRTLMFKVLYPFINRVLVVAKSLGDEIAEKRKCSKDKMRVVLNGVDHVLFKPRPKDSSLLKRLDICNNDIIIGSVGRIEPVKNYLLFVKLIWALQKVNKNVKGLLVGDGSEKHVLKSEIKRLGLEKQFILAGRSDEVPKMISMMDIFLLTSYSEGMSVSILEAMSCGKPIIATDVGNNRELVKDGINGFIFDLEDFNSLFDKALFLVKNTESRLKFADLSRKKAVNEFSIDSMIEKYSQLYSLKK